MWLQKPVCKSYTKSCLTQHMPDPIYEWAKTQWIHLSSIESNGKQEHLAFSSLGPTAGHKNIFDMEALLYF